MRWIAAWTDWLEAERSRLPLWLPVFMGAGVLAYYGLRFEPPVWLGPAAALLTAAAATRLRRFRWLLAPVAAAALGFAAAQFATARAPPIEADLPFQAIVVTGSVQAVESLPDGRRITIQPAFLDGATEPLRRSVRVRLRSSDGGDLQTGDSVSLRAVVRPPAPPAYPGGWDLQRDAFYSGIGASGYAIATIERTAQAQPRGFMLLVQRLRETIANRVNAVIPGAAGAVSVTLLTGASMAIPPLDHAAFRDSGLAHLLAVAGLHIGIVMGFALVLTRLGFAVSEHASLFWPTKKLAALAALAVGGGYMLLTGMHVPIMRSFAMACLFTLAVLADRLAVSLRGLAVAATVLMLLVPWEVPDVSFQMSFSAVLALIAGYEALRPWLRRLHGTSWRRRFASHLVALALTSALAGSASAPYGAYHFGHVQVYFVLANMIAVPLTAFWVMPAGLIGLMLMPLHLEALALVPMGWGAEAILWVARATSALPAATFAVPHMPIWGLCVFSLGLAWLGLWRTPLRLAGVAIMAAGLASPWLYRPPDLLVSNDGRMIALRTPDGAFLQAAKGASKFTRDAWAQYWAADSFRPMADDPAGAVRCQADACVLLPDSNRPGALLVRGAMHPAGCGRVSVIVSGEPARGLCPRPWPVLVDRFTVWRNGSAAIWLEPDGARVVTDRAARGERPWVPPPPKPRPPAASTLPPALVDEAVQPGPLAGVPSPDHDNGE
nr:ComEC/Rec2 family competence protein [uncultured Rhodopila sp.]